MISEHYRLNIPDFQRDLILKDYARYVEFKERHRLGLTKATHKDALVHEFTILNDLIDISRPVLVSSHRRRVGPWIVRAKKVLMRLAKPIIKTTLSRQIILNEYLVSSYQRSRILEERLEKLEQNYKFLLRRLERSK